MPKSEYSFGACLLHYIALNFTSILEMSFKMEQMLRKSEPIENSSESFLEQKHVFISGLARAGTTALMRLLYETGEFCSLTYRDMPFPLAPSLWKRCMRASTKEGSISERAHGDGIMVDFDSPEAIEEVFWRVFCGNQYLLPDRLMPMEAGQHSIENFRIYIADLLQINNANRYLSKNNNNVIRISSLKKAFPNCAVLIPYRDPVQQSLSLFNQHCRFIEIHREDKFAKKYMKWLVHHEFGSDHRYFDVDKTVSTNSPNNPEYWLDQWTRVYRFLLKQAQEAGMELYFIGYEALCDNPEVVWKALAQHIGVKEELPHGFVLSKAPEHKGGDMDSQTLSQAYQIYFELRNKFETIVWRNHY